MNLSASVNFPTGRGPSGTRLAMLAAVLAACGHLLAAQQAPGPPAEPLPTFRSGIEAVQIDAFVTDASGNPVTDLSADDFEIIEAGVPQAITTFSVVNIPVERRVGRREGAEAEPDVHGNDVPEGRIYVIALDEVAPANALRTREFLSRFLDEHLQPHDVAAVVLTGRGLATAGQDFTSNRRLLLNAIGRFSGGFGDPCAAADAGARSTGPASTALSLPRGYQNDFAVRARLASLRALIESMARMPGGRKSLVYVSECVGYDMFDIVDYRGQSLSIVGEDAHAAMAAATRGNVVVYPVEPSGLCLDDCPDIDARADLTALAHVTGGFALSESNSYAQAFERIVQENSTYYVLGFNSSHMRRDGRYVRLQVRVTRPGLQVRSRDGYVAPLGRAPSVQTGASGSPAVAAMANPFATRGIAMRVFAAPYKGSSRHPAVALAIEVDVSTLGLVEREGAYTGEFEITYVATDEGTRVHPGGRHTFALTLTPVQYAQLSASGLRVTSQLALPPGRYQLRVGVGHATRSGSIVYDLEVPDFGRGDIVLSGLSVTSDRTAATLTVRPDVAAGGTAGASRCRPPSCTVPLLAGAPSGDDPLRGGLPGPPTTAREFERDDTLALFAEVYRNGRRPPAHTIVFTTELRDDDGLVIPMTSEARASTADRRPSGGHGFTALLPLHDVPPGRYVLHVEARSDVGEVATSRAIPIQVR